MFQLYCGKNDEYIATAKYKPGRKKQKPEKRSQKKQASRTDANKTMSPCLNIHTSTYSHRPLLDAALWAGEHFLFTSRQRTLTTNHLSLKQRRDCTLRRAPSARGKPASLRGVWPEVGPVVSRHQTSRPSSPFSTAHGFAADLFGGVCVKDTKTGGMGGGMCQVVMF